MIYSLCGILLEKTPAFAVIECGGVGYMAAIPATAAGALPAVGEKAQLYTHLNITENDVSLYGFANQSDREMFRILISVSGVGPKAGLAILSALPVEKIVLAVSASDDKAFTAANGVGPKLAKRLVLELKDKVAKGLDSAGMAAVNVQAVSATQLGGAAQAVAALTSLGYTGSEASAAVAGVDQTLPVAEMIRLALQGIAKGK